MKKLQREVFWRFCVIVQLIKAENKEIGWKLKLVSKQVRKAANIPRIPYPWMENDGENTTNKKKHPKVMEWNQVQSEKLSKTRKTCVALLTWCLTQC